MAQEYYFVDLKCHNCKKLCYNIKIPFGTSIEDFGETENLKCSKCDCPIIKVKEKKE